MARFKETLEPLRIAPFRRLITAILVNTAGDVFGLVALSILVFDRTGSALALMVLFVAKMFVPAIFAPAVASRLESFSTRLGLFGLYLANALVYVLLALVAGDFVLGILLALAFVDGVLTLAGRTLVRGTSATVLKAEHQLREGNALINNVFTLSFGVGPLLAGLVVVWLGISGALLIDAGSFVAAGVVLLGTRGLPRKELLLKKWWPRLREGLSYIRSQPALRLLFAADAASIVFLAAVLPIEVALVKETFNAGDAEFGLFLALWGIGMALGGLLFTLERKAPLGVLIVLGGLAMGVAYVGVGMAPVFAVAAAINLIGGIGNGIQVPAIFTALQHRTSDVYQVRVAGATESVAAAMPGVGYALGGALAAMFSPRATFLVAGGGVILIVATLGPRIRRVVDEPGPEEREVPMERYPVAGPVATGDVLDRT